MARSASLSGYLEFLPAERMVELHVLDTLRQVFESHGFASLESRAVETMETLMGKGEVDKEVYAVSRIHDDAPGKQDAKLALHFDLTVPFARYVSENAGFLSFPFRRYQIQKVWRGERPQAGRFREFTQADIDIVGDGALPFRADIELAVVMVQALNAVNIGEFQLRINNRKLSQGFYGAIGLEDPAAVLRIADKLDKIGGDAVVEQIQSNCGATEEQAQLALALAQIRTEDSSFADKVRALVPAGVDTELLDEGISELSEMMTSLNQQVPGRAVADLSIARGLDYYTGTVYETVLYGHEDLGSICSGGRYDSLAAKGKRTFPGVGLSIGVSRVVSALINSGELTSSRSVPTVVYVALAADSDWDAAQEVADQLRSRGISTEVAYRSEKFGKQIKHADRRGIPYVWFTDDQGNHEVKDIRSGEQVPADPQQWAPPVEDLKPQISAGEAEPGSDR